MNGIRLFLLIWLLGAAVLVSALVYSVAEELERHHRNTRFPTCKQYNCN